VTYGEQKHLFALKYDLQYAACKLWNSKSLSSQFELDSNGELACGYSLSYETLKSLHVVIFLRLEDK